MAVELTPFKPRPGQREMKQTDEKGLTGRRKEYARGEEGLRMNIISRAERI